MSPVGIELQKLVGTKVALILTKGLHSGIASYKFNSMIDADFI